MTKEELICIYYAGLKHSTAEKLLKSHYREERKRDQLLKAYKDTEIALEDYKKQVESRRNEL